jgi:hypothetical protein
MALFDGGGAMKTESLCEKVAVNLTERERLILERLAQERGATLSGVIRKLLRDAGKTVEPEQREGVKQ